MSAVSASCADPLPATTVAVTVYVTVPPTGMATVESLMLPVPAAAHVAPPAPAQVQEIPVRY
jgi:hypothetical protein